MGEKITGFLEKQGEIHEGVIHYADRSFLNSGGNADLVVLVGVICGLSNQAALTTLKLVHRMLRGGGQVVVSSSNENMLNRDPLASFLIQHIGSATDPFESWGSELPNTGCDVRFVKKRGV